jgi:hypothetical protein
MGLFTPAWKSKNEKRALRAVEKMTDQKKLERVAKEAESRSVRATAVRKLTDQTVLADIAKNDSNWDVREAAVEKLTDQTVLADIAKNDSDGYIRSAAVKKLTDQTVLAHIAKNDSWESVRSAAVKKLTDQTLLADIAKNDSDSYVRKAAVDKLTDQKALADVAKNTSDWEVRKAAVEKLTDPKALKDVAGKYFADISSGKWDAGENSWSGGLIQGDWQKVATLVSIAKKFPEILKENWSQIGSRIQMLHEDRKGYSQGKIGDSCHEDIKARNNTAASLGLVFPPYPFNDETNDKTDVKL